MHVSSSVFAKGLGVFALAFSISLPSTKFNMIHIQFFWVYFFLCLISQAHYTHVVTNICMHSLCYSVEMIQFFHVHISICLHRILLISSANSFRPSNAVFDYTQSITFFKTIFSLPVSLSIIESCGWHHCNFIHNFLSKMLFVMWTNIQECCLQLLRILVSVIKCHSI